MAVVLKDGWASGTLADDRGREWPVRQFRQENPSNPGMLLAPGKPQLTLHTTETWTYITQLRVPSQWQVGEALIGQHIRDGHAGDALHVWDRFSMGIEIVHRVADQPVEQLYLPKEFSLGPLVALVAWLHRTGRITTGLKRPANWPLALDRGPQASETYYRRHANLWPDVAGVYGHVEVPHNAHYDPASFDYPRFFARVTAAIDVQEGKVEDDRLTQLQAGTDAYWTAFMAQGSDPGAAPEDKSPWFRKGWTNARRGAINPKAAAGLKRGDTVTLG